MRKKIMFSLFILLCHSTAHSTDKPITEYLESEYSPKVMAIGEGETFNNYDDSVFRVDINPNCKPDFEADINDLKKMGFFPDGSFDKILLCYIPVDVFDIHPLKTFTNLCRTLKKGGTLELNHMHGFIVHDYVTNYIKEAVLKEENIEKKESLEKMSIKDAIFLLTLEDRVSPFKQYLTLENDFIELSNGKKVPKTSTKKDHHQQVDNFFKKAGFQSVERTQKNELGIWWIVTK